MPRTPFRIPETGGWWRRLVVPAASLGYPEWSRMAGPHPDGVAMVHRDASQREIVVMDWEVR